MTDTGDTTMNTRKLVELLDGLIAGTLSITGGGFKDDYFVPYPTSIVSAVGGGDVAALPVAVPGLPCNGVVVDVEGSQVAGELVDEVQCTLDPTLALDAAWTEGANWVWGAGVETATLANTAFEEATGKLQVGATYLTIMRLATRTAGSAQVRLGTALGTARSAAGTWWEFVTCTAGVGVYTDQKLGCLGTGFSGTTTYLRAYRCRPMKAAFSPVEYEFRTIVAATLGAQIWAVWK